jgi:hypothetical protein
MMDDRDDALDDQILALDPADPEMIYGSEEPMDGRCCARTKSAARAGLVRYCTRDPMPNGRCHKHGGKTPAGIAAPSFKHGRYSENLPARLAERYAEAQEDPTLLSYRDDVALVDARIADLLSRVDTGESGATWAGIRKLWADFRRYRAAGDVRNMQQTLEQLDEPLGKGVADHAAWAEVGTLLDRRARLVEAERRRLEQMQQVMTVEEAMGLLGTVLDVIRRNVSDRATLDRIGAELSGLVTVDALPLAARSRRSGRRRA